MTVGPMHASIERLLQVARARLQHYDLLAQQAGTTGRQQTALRMASYYGDIVRHLASARRVSERAP